MKTSEYNNPNPYTRKILYNGINSYESKLANSKFNNEHVKYKPLHLSKSYNAAGRLEMKLLAKTDWFRKKKSEESESPECAREEQKQESKKRFKKAGKDGRQVACRLEKPNDSMKKGPTTVMFVPWTVNGRLVGALKAEEDRLAKLTGFRIKFTEEGGTPLWQSFSTKLSGGLDCSREGCVTCAQPEEKKLD